MDDYIDHAPSSSTHSAPETSNCSNKKVKRHRMQDSDTELERDKRKRRNDELSGMPGTSRSNAHSSSNSDYGRTMLRENVERKDPPDKGISPDSGVHSTENDPGDENDIHSAQTIINLITKLSPPLSPIKQRPFEKKAERERKELEMRERERKERYESQMREEEERERLEKEQAERDEKLKSERLEYERKERDREEKQRKDKERDEKERRKKEEREEKDREEKERKEKEREWRNRREREVEDKFKEQKEHEDHLRRDAVREMKKQKGVDYASVGKRSKDSCRKDGQERVEKVRTGNANRTKQKESDENLSERISRLDGEITLKGLDRLKLNQLIEIGRRMGRMKV
ncbi:hypothetical protein DICVIV_12309 [Dictyocaulus viviparus]|uniref:Uncharacterized protein n=1 Tax=Dictyocaulus viviparus TaxID=29172 RepID=A0A0D8XAU1_DICVI|nr:hypothetical protein DICVIV_12309 [Dictyocaulus viviparus]